MLRDMFKKTYTKIDMKYRAGEKESARTAEEDAPVIPAGLWKKCNKCENRHNSRNKERCRKASYGQLRAMRSHRRALRERYRAPRLPPP